MRSQGVRSFILFLIFVFVPTFAHAKKVVQTSTADVSLRHEVENAIGRGLAYLATRQNKAGWWSQEEYPALTALALTAFEGDPSGFHKKKYSKTIDAGYAYLLGCIKPDGGIYVDELSNYNTSVSLMALLVADRPEYKKDIINARNFIVGLQDDKGKSGAGGSPFYGGIGYGDDGHHSDLSNTMYAMEALYYSRYLKNDKGSNSDVRELNWKAAIRFISRTQNLPGYNDQSWASGDPDNRGGFVYYPGKSNAGKEKLSDGKTALRSYGSMSYAGLLSYIYAQLDRNDPRVKAVYKWLTDHYTLKENPGMGKSGLYYYYHTMAKGLSTYGTDTLRLKNGRTINWRTQLAKRLINLQNSRGYWVNQNGRWWERDPVLVTSYSVITLEIVWKGL